MNPLEEHERFEIEVLDSLKRGGFLEPLVFVGGTMLRLCHELPRYSVDLDFWFSGRTRYVDFYNRLLTFLKGQYELTDCKNKHYSLLFELRGKPSERKLKIEIRKEVVKKGIEARIAYSTYSTKQVLIPSLSPAEMARWKILAALCAFRSIRQVIPISNRQLIPIQFVNL